MKFQIQISETWLKVISGFAVNLSAGLFLLGFGIADIWTLIVDMVFAIFMLVLAKLIEDILINNYV